MPLILCLNRLDMLRMTLREKEFPQWQSSNLILIALCVLTPAVRGDIPEAPSSVGAARALPCLGYQLPMPLEVGLVAWMLVSVRGTHGAMDSRFRICKNCRKWKPVGKGSSICARCILRATRRDPRAPESARPLPPFPTSAIPGSAAKVAIMEDRWRRGFHIHHPDDNQLRGYCDDDQ